MSRGRSASVADRIRIWYSATSNFASILTALILNCFVDLPAEFAQVSVNVVLVGERQRRWPAVVDAADAVVDRALRLGHGSFAYSKLHVIARRQARR